jgi:hypothetical protein
MSVVPEPPGEPERPSLNAFRGTFFGLLAASSLPVLCSPYLPMQDLPNHLAIVATLARRATEPAWSEQFEWRLGFAPYAAYYALTLGLARFVGVLAANKLVLVAYTLATPVAFLFAARSLGVKNRWCALLAFPLVYSDFYLAGFTNTLLSVPLSLLGVGLGALVVRRERGRVGLIIALAGVGAALYLTHPLSLGILALTLAAVLPTYGRPRDTLLPLAALSPALALAALSSGAASLGDMPAFELPAADKALYFLMTPLLAVDAASRPLFFVAAGALALVLALAARSALDTLRSVRADRPTTPHETPIFGAMLFAAAYAALPFGIGPVIWLDSRFGYWAWVLLLLSIGRWAANDAVGRAAAVVVAVSSLVAVGKGHQQFQIEVGPTIAALAPAPDGARLLSASFGPPSQAFQPIYVRRKAIPFFSLHAHTGAYYHVAHGGRSPYMTFHASLPWIPLRVRDEAYATFPIAGPFAPGRLLRRLPQLAPNLDLLLLRGANAATLKQVSEFCVPIAEEPGTTLFKVVVPSPHGAPPSPSAKGSEPASGTTNHQSPL